MNLVLSPELSLPITATTKKIAWLGGNGSGKTYCSQKFAELLWDACAQFVTLDPVGRWWGLRADGSEKGSGIPITVFGGLYGDLPLGPRDGRVLADVIADTGISAIVDVSQFANDSQRAIFVTDFVEHLYKRKEKAPSALHLFLEEAQEFIPQNPPGGGASEATLMRNRILRTVNLGRNIGFGISMITPRPQNVSKEALGLAELIFAFRMTGIEGRDYMTKWFRGHGVVGIGEKLPVLNVGEPYAWSPAFLEYCDFIKILSKRTADVSATPEVGVESQSRTLTPVAVDALRDLLARSESADDMDMKRLREKVKELEATLKSNAPKGVASTGEIEKAVKPWRERCEKLENDGMRLVSALDQAQADLAAYKRFGDAVISHIDGLSKLAVEFGQEKGILDSAGRPPELPVVSQMATAPRQRREPRSQTLSEPSADFKINATQQKILDAVAWFESIGIDSPTNVQIGAVALMDTTGGYYSNLVGPLSTNGLVVRGRGALSLTDAGRQVANVPDTKPTLAAYHDNLCWRVTSMKSGSKRSADILRAIIAKRGPMTTAEIGAAIEIDHTGGYFSNTIGPLSTLGLIKRSRSLVEPTALLFPEGLR